MEQLEKGKKIIIMLTVMLTMLFASLNQTIVNTALPRIVADLGGMHYYTWIFTIYLLASSIVVILVGKLSDMYGRKWFLISGTIIFIIGAFLAGTATSMTQLIIYRGIQGLGAGTIMSSSMTTVADLFSPAERGRWQGLIGAVFGLSSIVGPLMGGYIVDKFSWKWVFWINIPIGLTTLILLYLLFPNIIPNIEKKKIDYFGALLMVIVLIPLLLGFSWAGTVYSWASVQIISLFLIALIGLILFILTERKAENPILPLYLFKNNIFTLSNIIVFLIGIGMFGAIMFIPLFIQGVVGSSATKSGLVLMPMSFSLFISSAIGGQIISRTGKYKVMAVLGSTLSFLGMYLLTLMKADTTNTTVIINMIILGIGLGITMPLFVLTVQNAIPQKYLGVATSSVQLFRQMGGTVGVALMGTIMSHRMKEEIAKNIPPEASIFNNYLGNIDLTNPQILFNPKKIAEFKSLIPAESLELFNQMLEGVRIALAYALHDVFFYSSLIMLASLIVTFFLREIPLKETIGIRKREKTNI